MQRPWQVWLWFALSLAVVVPAMAWLTLRALELDLQVTRSGRMADLEEDISLALWRMDVAVAPLVAQEAARPSIVYRSFLSDPLAAENAKSSASVSPLIVQPSEFVRLHFELAADGTLTSPQVPTGVLQELAIDNGAPLANINTSCISLNELSETLQHETLVKQLPQEQLPPLAVTQLAWDNRASLANLNSADANNSAGAQVLMQNDEQAGLLYREQTSNAQQANSAALPQAGAQASNAAPRDESQQLRASPDPTTWSEQYTSNPYGYGRSQKAVVERGELEFQRRNKALQTLATTEVVKQRKNLPPDTPLEKVSEGVSAPLWVGGELLLARRVKIDNRELVQGCWFDWPKLKQFLLAEGAGDGTAALPGFDLRPIRGDAQVSPARRLATLPVELIVPTPQVLIAPLSPIRLSLWSAWGCLGLATICVAILLQGVVTLSERRGAFVSAVTHELRTPLTTFRMYAEMLSSGMVRDPQQRQQYTDTLRVEADRLSHLVENVLAYAQLERGKRGGRREEIALGRLIERSAARLADRAEHAAMALALDIPPEAAAVLLRTDPQAVEQILFNLVDNACKYAHDAVDRTIRLSASVQPSYLELRVCDHGRGISPQFARRLFQPFSKSCEEAATTAPGVGLGLALCKRLARELGGSLALEPASNAGATFRLTLPRN